MRRVWLGEAPGHEAPAPPPDWAGRAFDDRDWPISREPLHVGQNWPVGGRLLGRAGYHRTRFVLPKASAAGKLTLRLTYIGGVRVLLNGTEIARGHLPAGDLDDEAVAEVYPPEAYRLKRDEMPTASEWRYAGSAGAVDLPGRFDVMSVAVRTPAGKVYRRAGGPHGPCARVVFNRKGWDRLRALRHRVLGPLTLPRKLLRNGANVLAVETRTSDHHPGICAGPPPHDGRYRPAAWRHMQLVAMELAARPPAAVVGAARPPGVQVWTADMHYRADPTDYRPPGLSDRDARTVRLTGVRNGTFSAQLLVGTTTGLDRVTASVAKLSGPGGAVIAADALRVFYMSAYPDLERFAEGLCGGGGRRGYWPVARQFPWSKNHAGAAEHLCFDQITAHPPERVPAGACQPLWLSLRVPREARAGRYAGTIDVLAREAPAPQAARAARQWRFEVPVELEVLDWTLPDPLDFTTLMAVEQSPYGVARLYDVEPWSEAHLKLMEPSFRQLARVGADWLNVPVVTHTEFGNGTDSPIRWFRRTEDGAGGPALDFSRLDRYLDLAVRHLGKVRVISLAIVLPNTSAEKTPPLVMVTDAATGRTAPEPLWGPSLSDADRRRIWAAFARSVLAHMRKRGLDASVHWGYCWDRADDKPLADLLAELAPGVYWAAGPHHGAVGSPARERWRARSSIHTHGTPGRGWKDPAFHVHNPRSDILAPMRPYAFRLVVPRCIQIGLGGLGRVGADYWAGTYLHATRGAHGMVPGLAVAAVLWPGPDGAESTARYEALVEGLQEAEARIALQRALDGGKLSGEQAERARRALVESERTTRIIPPFNRMGLLGRYYCSWRANARRLYGAAAALAPPPEGE